MAEVIAKIIVQPELSKRQDVILELLKEANFPNPHPDLLLLEDEEKLGVEAAKNIRQYLSLKPYQNQGRAVAVISAHNFTPEAQNALLKTLEELPDQATVIMGVDNQDQLLATILSRCQIIQNNQSTDAKLTEDHLLQIRKLQECTLSERFSYIEKLENKEGFLLDLFKYTQDQLAKEDRYLNFARELQEAKKWLDQNVTVRAILEYLMLVWPTREK